MNTKFKKTALEDDAEIYQHGTKSATKDDIKKLPPKNVSLTFVTTIWQNVLWSLPLSSASSLLYAQVSMENNIPPYFLSHSSMKSTFRIRMPFVMR